MSTRYKKPFGISAASGQKDILLSSGTLFPLNLKFSQTRVGDYVGDMKTDLVYSSHGTVVYILFDEPGWVFLETDQGTRAFDEVWIPNDVIILRGS